MRIISGKYKGRKIETGDIRPTMSKVREALFNILSHGEFCNVIPEATVLDLFCGSGALGLEALSRGAKHVIMVDENINIAVTNVKRFNLDNVTLINKNISNLPTATTPCNLVFIDPPYKQAFLAEKVLDDLIKKSWLAPQAIIAIELPKSYCLSDLATHYKLLDTRTYGITKIAFIFHDS